MTEPSVTAVILTHDRPAMLARALSSLTRATVPLDILVIDNGSNRETKSFLASESRGRPHFRVESLGHNFGVAGGRQLGARFCDSEFILYLDDDAELLPGSVEHLLADLNENPGAIAASATVLNPDGRVAHSGGDMTVTAEIAHFELIGTGLTPDDPALAGDMVSGWLPGTACLMRREVLIDYPWDLGMSAYFEDNEWSWRVARRISSPFRRSGMATAIHRPRYRPVPPSLEGRRLACERFASLAYFYEKTGLIMSPWTQRLLPPLRLPDGSCNLPAARLLLGLTHEKGGDWLLASWVNGWLDGLSEASTFG